MLSNEAVNIYALSCDKLDKYEYLNGEDPTSKLKLIEQKRHEYSPLQKLLENLDKQTDIPNS